jgi:hypothetical protein
VSPGFPRGRERAGQTQEGVWDALLDLNHWNACSYISEPTPHSSPKPLAPGLFSANSGGFRAVFGVFGEVFEGFLALAESGLRQQFPMGLLHWMPARAG